MHFGFSALRVSLPMNLRAVRRGFIVWSTAQADIDRIIEKPTVRRRLGQRR
jgi:glutathione S-transferase